MYRMESNKIFFEPMLSDLKEDLGSSAEFEEILYLGEVTIKLACNIYCTLLRTIDEDKANLTIKSAVVDGDGVGGWLDALRRAIEEIRRSNNPKLKEFTEFWTQKASKVIDLGSSEIKRFTTDLSPESFAPSKKISGILDLVVFARNKNAHGAYREAFYQKHNKIFKSAVLGFVNIFIDIINELNIMIFDIEVVDGNLSVRCIGEDRETKRDIENLVMSDGLYIGYSDYSFLRAYDSIISQKEKFYFMNSRLDSRGFAEYLSYSDGTKIKSPVSRFNTSIKKSRSHTSSKTDLVEGDVAWHNLPQPTGEYVVRKTLEESISNVLCDNKRRIITLYGRGGAGKTTLALVVAHKIASGELYTHKFSHIVWASARNVDLLETGPKDVSRDISNIDSIAKFIKTTLKNPSTHNSLEFLREVLGNETGEGLLLIIDNFETAENPKYIHDTLEDIVVLPNKVLFTSRTRKLEKDFPLEVYAMEDSEARELIYKTAKDFNSEIDEGTIQQIMDKSGRVPYIIKLMVGGYIRTGGYIGITNTMSDEAVRNALFLNTYRSLDKTSKMLFTSISKLGNEILMECAAGFLNMWLDARLDREGLFKIVDEMRAVSLVSERTVNEATWLNVPVDARTFATLELEKESFQIQVKPSVTQFARLLSRVNSVDHADEVPEAVAQSYVECDRANLQWLDKFVQGMSIYNKDLLKVRAYGVFNRFEVLSKEEIRIAFEDAVGAFPADALLRYDYAKYLRAVMNDYGAASIHAKEASDNEIDNIDYVLFAAQTINEYFAREKKGGNAVNMVLRRQLIDSLAKRMQLMTTNNKNHDPRLYTQLFWLYLNGGQEKSAFQVRQLANKLFPKDAYVRDLNNISLSIK